MTNDRKQRAERAEQMRKEREKADRRQRNVITLAIVAVVIALVAIGGYAITTTANDRANETEVVTPTDVTEDNGILYTAEELGGEPAEDPVNVVLYEDFQCPVCQAFEQANGGFLMQQVEAGEITVEYRPISFLDQASANEYSSRAANAALCAMDAGGPTGYKKVHDLLYANQPPEGGSGPEDAELFQTVDSAATGATEDCIVQKRFGPWIEEATEASRDAGVSGTPTVIIDGETVQSESGGVPSIADLQAAIDAAKA